MHVLAIGYSPVYLAENRDGIRQDWPRIPLPASLELLQQSAALGRRLAALIDTEHAAPGVTRAPLRADLRTIGAATRVGGGSLDAGAGDLDLTAGWGYASTGGVVMGGTGKLVKREYTADELAAIEEGARAEGLDLDTALGLLGQGTNDVYLNGVAYWRNVPDRVWEQRIGGYQVIKKWLSYRERELLGRGLTTDEVREVAGMARRLAAVLLLGPALDANYRAVVAAPYAWPASAAAI
jgi:hypothetical protein